MLHIELLSIFPYLCIAHYFFHKSCSFLQSLLFSNLHHFAPILFVRSSTRGCILIVLKFILDKHSFVATFCEVIYFQNTLCFYLFVVYLCVLPPCRKTSCRLHITERTLCRKQILPNEILPRTFFRANVLI